MRLYTVEAVRRMERETVRSGVVSAPALMERAAAHVGESAMRFCREGQPVAVFCGVGNNGGDGIAAASWLMRHGVPCRAFLVGDRQHMTVDTAGMEQELLSLGGTLEPYSAAEDSYLLRCGVLIDALLGIGLNRPVEGDMLAAVQRIRALHIPVVSVDIPSGVDADTGCILGDAVNADVTVTFSCAKPGHFILPGGLRTGALEIRDIGVPSAILDAESCRIHAIHAEDIALPARPRDAHKGNFGKLLILGGSTGLTGAPCMVAQAAVRSGAGLVFVGVPQSIYPIVAGKLLEPMPFPLPCDENGILSEAALEPILPRLTDADACVLGPGLGRSDGARQLVEGILKNATCPVVLDADGISAIGTHRMVLRETACPCVLTPHDGEFARLGGSTAAGRLTAARGFAHETGCTLVLKGCHTLTAGADGTVWVNTTGNPGMAKGGSGDILAGILGALLAQGLSPTEAAYTAVYLHGLAGDLASSRYGQYSMTPGDLLSDLPNAFQTVTR